MLVDMLRRIAREKIAPRAQAIDEKGEFPHGIMELFQQHELLGLPFMELEGKKEECIYLLSNFGRDCQSLL